MERAPIIPASEGNKKPTSRLRNGVTLIPPCSGLPMVVVAKLEDGLLGFSGAWIRTELYTFIRIVNGRISALGVPINLVIP